ncbi:MAG: hypothetical protein EOO39_08040, partial [Cytophagaceae bacterium]
MYYLTLRTDDIPTVTQAIQAEFRLDELVQIKSITDTTPDADAVLVTEETIQLPLDWSETLPPILLPNPLPFSPDNLLSFVFTRLENWEKAYAYSRHERLLADTIDLTNRLQSGVPLVAPARPVNGVGTFDTYRRWHNRAVALHYGNLESDAADSVAEAYQSAMELAPNAEYRAYTAKQFATLLLDTGQLTKANHVLEQASVPGLSEAAKHELLAIHYAVWLQQLVVPYDVGLLEKTKSALWQVLAADQVV